MTAQILVVSDGTLEPVERLADAVSRAGLVPVIESDPGVALETLRAQPRVVVVDAAMAGAEDFVGGVRTEAALAGCPVIAEVARVSDDCFTEVLEWGADDVVPAGSLRALTAMLGALREYDPTARPPATQGTVLIAAPSVRERLIRGRLFRNVGYEVVFAVEAGDVIRRLDESGLAFAVVDAELFPDGVAGLRSLLAAGRVQCPVVAVVAPHDVDGLSNELRGHAKVGVVSRHAPPEDTLFIGNAMLRPELANARASERLLYSTVVSFRAEGEGPSNYGMSYNVSAEGLFVRTVMPPPPGTDVWVELRPPMMDGLVHVEARVMWHRRFGPSAGATAPAGFGARITGGSARSLSRWLEGYARLLQRRGGAVETVPDMSAQGFSFRLRDGVYEVTPVSVDRPVLPNSTRD